MSCLCTDYINPPRKTKHRGADIQTLQESAERQQGAHSRPATAGLVEPGPQSSLVTERVTLDTLHSLCEPSIPSSEMENNPLSCPAIVKIRKNDLKISAKLPATQWAFGKWQLMVCVPKYESS